MKLTLALAQINTYLGDVEANLEKHLALLKEARASGADLLIFPELSLTGYVLQDLASTVAHRPAADDPVFRHLLKASHEVDLMVGFVDEDRRHRFFIAAAYLARGEVIHVHHKVYLPTYGLFDEGRFTRAGDRIRTEEVGEPLCRVGLSICEDFWHASLPMIQAQDGAALLVNLAAGPARAPGSAAGLAAIAGWHNMQDTYALLGTVAVAFCNRVGNEEGLTFWGGSRLLAPDGSTIAEGPLYEEALLVGSLETDDLRMQRYGLPLLADERLELVRRELDRIIAERAGLPAPDADTAS